jgi:hypothetical protein
VGSSPAVRTSPFRLALCPASPSSQQRRALGRCDFWPAHLAAPSDRSPCAPERPPTRWLGASGNVDPHPEAGIDGAVQGLAEIACASSIHGLSLLMSHPGWAVCEVAHTHGRIVGGRGRRSPARRPAGRPRPLRPNNTARPLRAPAGRVVCRRGSSRRLWPLGGPTRRHRAVGQIRRRLPFPVGCVRQRY